MVYARAKLNSGAYGTESKDFVLAWPKDYLLQTFTEHCCKPQAELGLGKVKKYRATTGLKDVTVSKWPE